MIAFQTFACGGLGNSGNQGVVMSPGETVSKLRSAPSRYLAQAPAPKLGVAVDLNRCRDRVGCLLRPDTLLTRSRPHRGTDRTSRGRGRYLAEGRALHQQGAWPTSSWRSVQRTLPGSVGGDL